MTDTELRNYLAALRVDLEAQASRLVAMERRVDEIETIYLRRLAEFATIVEGLCERVAAAIAEAEGKSETVSDMSPAAALDRALGRLR